MGSFFAARGMRSCAILAVGLAALVGCAQKPFPDQFAGDSRYPEGYFICSGELGCDEDTMSSAEYRASLIARLGQIEFAISPEGLGYSQRDNKGAVLTWTQSYVVRAYLSWFRATNDVTVLSKVAKQVKNILASRDDVTQFADYTGAVRPRWSTNRYSEGYVGYVVTDGMIISGLAEFARMVLADSVVSNLVNDDGETYGTFANRVLDRVEETIASHNSDWDANVGAYKVENVPGGEYGNYIAPYNWEHAMGRALVATYRVRPKPEYLAKLTAIATRFKAGWVKNDDRTVSWKYSSELNLPEDTSHAHIEVNFMLEAYQAGLLFTESDLRTFALTFARRIIRPSKNAFAYSVDGEGDDVPVTVGLLWMPLAGFDTRLYDAVWQFYRVAAASPTRADLAFNVNSHIQMLGIAQLLEYRTKYVELN